VQFHAAQTRRVRRSERHHEHARLGHSLIRPPLEALLSSRP
jgi:hypothetical protein